ncbi:MAG: hypothetical protein JNM70_20845, partial [Anaerolineae bacterium]|nr:hypothetical protein [Anaerolineae bacterium]
MFGRKSTRTLGVVLALALMLTVIVGAVQAQDEKVLVIGWEQEPDVLQPGTSSTF